MENDKYRKIGKNFYDWYKSKKIYLNVDDSNQDLHAEIQRLDELIVYVKEKREGLLKKKG